MLLEQELEQNLVDAFGALEPLSDGVQIIGSRLGDKTERDDTKTIVAVSSAFRTHDAFSLSPITVRVGISIVTRGELDSTSQRHNEVVEAIVNQLSFWHKDGVSMQNALSSRKLMAGELRIDSGTAQVYDRTNNIWTDTIGFAIRGAERFWTEPTKNRIVWNDWSYTDFDTEIFTSAETLDDYLYGIGR